MTCEVMVQGRIGTILRGMNLFRALLAIMILALLGYTGVVFVEHGPDLFSVFFGDVAAVSWSGQFNLDFSCFLLLSGLWLAWRHRFSPSGLLLGLLAPICGILLLNLLVYA
jgi:hypothetical protein